MALNSAQPHYSGMKNHRIRSSSSTYLTLNKTTDGFSFMSLCHGKRSVKNKKISFFPDESYWKELTRPWKLVTFVIAMALLVYGALHLRNPDWDVGVTIVMGGLTYLTAPWSVQTISDSIRYKQRYWIYQIIAALFVAFFVIHWSYIIYHALVGNQTMPLLNFIASTPVYFLAGIVWLYRGTVSEFMRDLREEMTDKKSKSD